jgi:hypothetical protein
MCKHVLQRFPPTKSRALLIYKGTEEKKRSTDFAIEYMYVPHAAWHVTITQFSPELESTEY